MTTCCIKFLIALCAMLQQETSLCIRKQKLTVLSVAISVNATVSQPKERTWSSTRGKCAALSTHNNQNLRKTWKSLVRDATQCIVHMILFPINYPYIILWVMHRLCVHIQQLFFLYNTIYKHFKTIT